MLTRLIPTLKVEVTEDNSDLSPQQRLLLEQQYYSLDRIIKANERLDDKALGLLQGAGLILALVGALEFPQYISGESPIWAKVLIGIGFVAFASMVILLTRTWGPVDSSAPGTKDWARIFEKYIYISKDDSYNKVLSDCLGVYADLDKLNAQKARNLQWAIYLFLIQIAGLLGVAMLS